MKRYSNYGFRESATKIHTAKALEKVIYSCLKRLKIRFFRLNLPVGGQGQGDIDVVYFINGRLHVMELKNWPSGWKITTLRQFMHQIGSRFTKRFTRASKSVILAGTSQTPELIEFLEDANIAYLFTEAITNKTGDEEAIFEFLSSLATSTTSFDMVSPDYSSSPVTLFLRGDDG